MDNLDISDSLSSSFPWYPYGGSQFSEYQVNGDYSYLSQRSALEPIIEETSDDDDVSGGPNGHVWSHYDNQWSSESETGSVIRVELIQDADTISERDFACPPKRRKQEECNDEVVLRRPTLNDDYKYRIDLLDNSDAYSKRFCIDTSFDRFSDPDSLSFNSLSRSSSLIQFESLERQMQTTDCQTIQENEVIDANVRTVTTTTASATTTIPKSNDNENEANNSVPRCYYDIDKINFNSELFLNCQERTSSSESSSSTDNSIYYSDTNRESDTETKEAANGCDENDSAIAVRSLRVAHNPKLAFRCKNSVENLSEDSGYGDFPIRSRSKSIPNLNQDQLIEEDEELLANHRSLNNIDCHYKRNNNNNSNNSSKKQASEHSGVRTKCQSQFGGAYNSRAADSLKIDTTHTEKMRATKRFGTSKNSTSLEYGWSGDDAVRRRHDVLPPPKNTQRVSRKKTASSASLPNNNSTRYFSLPDIHILYGETKSADDGDSNEFHYFHDAIDSNRITKRKSVCCGDQLQSEKDSFIVASVPNNLNLYSAQQCASDFREFDACNEPSDSWNSSAHRNAINSYWQPSSGNGESVASKNFDLAQAFGGADYHIPSPVVQQQTFQQQKIINSSYSNLTALDYSGSTFSPRNLFGNQLRMMADKQKRASQSSSNRSSASSTEFSKCNFLLDEISAHFDRSLSILNDKGDLDSHDEREKTPVLETQVINESPPQPPPRRQHQAKKAAASQRDSLSSIEKLDPTATFDRDPTNLKTCYAESLEKCNFDLTESSNSIHLLEKSTEDLKPHQFSPSKHSTPSSKRDMVASTPNLFRHDASAASEEYLHISSAYNSLNPLPQSEQPAQMKSILSAGSRNSLGKGVSFYPYVSEISWLEQSSVEDTPDLSDNESSDNNTNFNDMSNSTSSITSPSASPLLLSLPSLTPNRTGASDNGPSSSLTHTTNTTDQPNNDIASACTASDTPHDNIDTADNDDVYYETQPRSLAALAERDRRREQLYQKRLAQKEQKQAQTKTTTKSNGVNNNSKDQQQQQRTTVVDSNDGTSIQASSIDSSTAMIVNERVSSARNSNNNSNKNVDARNQLVDDIDFDSIAQNHQQPARPRIITSFNYHKNKNSDNSSAVNGGCNSNSGDSRSNDKKLKMEKSKVSAINVPVNATGKIHNNEMLLPPKMNFDHKKQQKPGFLSRFTNFRFSLRGANKKKLKSIENSGPPTTGANNIVLVSTTKATPPVSGAAAATAPNTQVPMRNKSNNSNSRAGCYQRNSMRSNEFEYIPLKDPIAVVFDAPNQNSDKTINNTINGGNSSHVVNHNSRSDNNANATPNRNVLAGKPPLPKQPPPRVVGLCAKQQPLSPLNATHPSHYQESGNKVGTGIHSGGAARRHAHQQRSTSAPREINFNATDNGRQQQQHFHYLANARDYNDDDYQLRSSRQTNNTRSGLLKSAVSSDGLLMDNPNDSVFTNDGDDEADDGRIGLIETNLDTDETIISGKTRSLMELGPQQLAIRTGAGAAVRRLHNVNGTGATSNIEPRRPHKSMEFLLDKENQRFVLPPENELQKSHDNNTNFSEHQLRVQASLQRLNIPDWFQKYNGAATKTGETTTSGYVPGSFTKKRNSDVQRWTGLNSKTTSLSSLGSHRSDRSPLLLSPSAQSHHGHTGFSRWSTSHLNSSQTSPSASTRGSFSRGGPNSSILSNQSYASGNQSIRSSFRQPYLGWRSQEKLSQPRTPHERLASSMLGRQQAKQQQQQQTQQSPDKNTLSAKTTEPAVTPEIQSSIKEVTSAIVHFVNDQNNRATSSNSRSRSASPSSRNCWLESSFVGNKPMDSPQTPVIETTFSPVGVAATSTRVNGVVSPIPVLSIQNDRPTPASATLEDVLASLLGLPSDYRSSGDTNVINDTGCYLSIDNLTPVRRRSEGDAPRKQNDSVTPDNNDSPAQHRRVSLDSTESKSAGLSSTNVSTAELIKCRYPKCDSSATAVDARKHYKSCHNCSHMYCSRDCRRAHWEKHRKACLHSRVSVLCRQVLSACKDDNDTLVHLSILARRGYITQGRGVVRILFRSSESAEIFVKQGFQRIGEASYVRWPELLPQEMGPELYSELLRLSTEYKPDSKMLVYVAICVVSEAPSSTASSVKWERQLVSRCAKLKLSKALPQDLTGNNSNTNTGQINRGATPGTSTTTTITTTTTTTTIDPAAPAGTYITATTSTNNTDVLILTFSLSDKSHTLKSRELILQNIQLALKRRGVNLRKHYPEIYQRFHSFVEGTTERFMPVTLHPRDSSTGQSFTCIIMPNLGDSDRIKLPDSENGNIVTIDCLEIDQSTLID